MKGVLTWGLFRMLNASTYDYIKMVFWKHEFTCLTSACNGLEEELFEHLCLGMFQTFIRKSKQQWPFLRELNQKSADLTQSREESIRMLSWKWNLNMSRTSESKMKWNYFSYYHANSASLPSQNIIGRTAIIMILWRDIVFFFFFPTNLLLIMTLYMWSAQPAFTSFIIIFLIKSDLSGNDIEKTLQKENSGLFWK